MSFRVLLVDDHQMLREGLRAILELDEDIEVVADAGDGLVAIEMARTLTPDVVIMDIGMEGLNGIDATRQIRADNPRVKVIALSTYSDKSYVLSMLEAGASGYVLKSSAAAEIRRAVRAVAEEQHYLSPDITGVVVKAHVDGSAQTGASVRSILGSRECQILQLLAEGRTSTALQPSPLDSPKSSSAAPRIQRRNYPDPVE
jgi:two-component system NarL family response regulator